MKPVRQSMLFEPAYGETVRQLGEPIRASMNRIRRVSLSTVSTVSTVSRNPRMEVSQSLAGEAETVSLSHGLTQPKREAGQAIQVCTGGSF
jgi:hypothetical protein